MGQKYKTAQIVKELRATNGLITLAARNLHCTPQTIYNRAKQSPAIQQAISDSREELIDRAVLALRAAVTEREPWAVSLVLKTLGRARGYGEVSFTVDVKALNDDQLERLVKGEDITSVLSGQGGS